MTDGRRAVFALSAALAAGTLLAVAGGCGDPGEVGPAPFDFSDRNDAADAGPQGGDADADPGETSAGAPAGSPCRDASDCAGDRCLQTEEYPGGYCTENGCERGGCSGGDGVCVEWRDGSRACLGPCSSDADCRSGYSCEAAGVAERRACRPESDALPFNRTRQILGVGCDPERIAGGDDETRYRFEFELSSRAQSFLMVPYVTAGRLRPVDLETPNRRVDLQDEYFHHNARITESYSESELTGVGTYGEIALDWPIGVPYAPKFDDYAVPGGQYELRVETDETTPCLYVVEKRAGTTLDLNFYLVAGDGLTPETAETDPDFQEALGYMEDLYDEVGIEIGETRFFELDEEDQARFEVVNSREEAQRLTAHGEPPSDTLGGHLSVDVFLVETLRLENQSGQAVNVLGMSAGVPGAPGMHGNARNGLVFQTADLGFDNEHVGLIMAHEIGHYLGLRHTTEIYYGTEQGERLAGLFGTTDPIEDTEVCENISENVRNDPSQCADYDNLMFPVAPPPDEGEQPGLTSGQGAALRANPLVTDR